MAAGSGLIAPERPAVTFDVPEDADDALRASSQDVRFLVLPVREVLAVDGRGSPADAGFQEAIGLLYPVAYALHFGLKRRGVTARVGALEGLWWQPGDPAPGAVQPEPGTAPAWDWTLLIGVPDGASDRDVRQAIADASIGRPDLRLERLAVRSLDEGRVAQIIHVGPCAAERPTIEHLREGIRAAGMRPRGRHHEIYLGDPRRAAPARLRTLLRQPVEDVR
ncbi:MAG TPA: GyrI-like domain-containing protein [Candidatus Limnocylindrales bacterium]|nr:GyrI-like domain-containing protein [Candidatus Limnocylindrales bacterium]